MYPDRASRHAEADVALRAPISFLALSMLVLLALTAATGCSSAEPAVSQAERSLDQNDLAAEADDGPEPTTADGGAADPALTPTPTVTETAAEAAEAQTTAVPVSALPAPTIPNLPLDDDLDRLLAMFSASNPVSTIEPITRFYDRSDYLVSVPIVGEDEPADQADDLAERPEPIHALDPQLRLDQPGVSCGGMYGGDYLAGLHHHDVGSVESPLTTLLAYPSEAEARLSDERILGWLRVCHDEVLTSTAGMRSVADFMGDDFPFEGMVFDAIKFRAEGAVTVQLVHDRFLARRTVSTPDPDQVVAAVHAAAWDLAAMLNSVEPDPLPTPSGVVTTDLAEPVYFAGEAEWAVVCSDTDTAFSIIYANPAHIELVAFEVDLDAGVFGPDNPEPAELRQRWADALVTFEQGDTEYDVLLPNPPSSRLTLSFSNMALDSSIPSLNPAIPRGYVVFLAESRGGPWFNDFDRLDIGEFSSQDARTISFEGVPCAPGTDTVTFSIDGFVAEEISPWGNEWVRVYDQNVVAPVLGR